MGVVVNKAELANWLGVSLPTLSSWMLKYGPEFPVLTRGTHGRGYEFDAPAVRAFLRQKQEEQAASVAAQKAERDEALAQLQLPIDVLPESAAATVAALSIKDQIAALDLRKRQREEAEKSRLLVAAAPVRDGLRAVLARIRSDQQAFIRRLGREHSWPDSYVREIERRLAEQQRATVTALDEIFAGATGDADAGQLAL